MTSTPGASLDPSSDSVTAAWHERAMWGLAILASFLVLAIHSRLSAYAYPVNDDWIFAAGGRDQGVWASLVGYLHDSGGRWASVTLYYCLGLFGDLTGWYPFLMLATLVILLGGVWVLLVRLPVAAAHRAGLTMILGAVLVTSLPVLTVGNLGWHSATPETLYWVGGAWVYALAMPLIACAVWVIYSPAGGWWPAVAVALLGPVIAGMSEIAGIAAAVIGLAIALTGQRRGWILFVAATLGFAASALAPGNLHRAELLKDTGKDQYGLRHIGPAMIACIWFTLHHLRDWVVQPAVLGALLAAAGLGARSPDAGSRRWRRTALVLIVALPVVVYAMALPTLTMVGFLEARHQGLISLIAVPFALAAAFAIGRAWPVPQAGWWRWLLAAAVVFLAVSGPWSTDLELPSAGAWILWLGAAVVVAGVAAWGLGRTWWRAVVGVGVVALCCSGPWVARLEMPAWIAWCIWPGMILAGIGAILWSLHGTRFTRFASCGAPLLIAAGLLSSPGHWNAWDDVERGQILHTQQLERDQQVHALLAAGHEHLALPFLGARGHVPRTVMLYELQPGWMFEGYCRYQGIPKALMTDRISNVRYIVDPPAPPAPAPAEGTPAATPRGEAAPDARPAQTPAVSATAAAVSPPTPAPTVSADHPAPDTPAPPPTAPAP